MKDELLPVTQEDRELYKFILDAPFATCSRIDNLPDDAPELQAIARHRKWAIGPIDEDDLETVIADSLDVDWLPRDGARAVMAALYENATRPAQGHDALVLRGIGKRTGDGFKDVTKQGEVVFVWNSELPKPYAPSQYPRVGCEGWSASTEQYDFTPATVDDLTAILTNLPTPQAEGRLVEQIDAMQSPDDEMVERMARAHHATRRQYHAGPHWDELDHVTQARWMRSMRAALTALRRNDSEEDGQ